MNTSSPSLLSLLWTSSLVQLVPDLLSEFWGNCLLIHPQLDLTGVTICGLSYKPPLSLWMAFLSIKGDPNCSFFGKMTSQILNHNVAFSLPYFFIFHLQVLSLNSNLPQPTALFPFYFSLIVKSIYFSAYVILSYHILAHGLAPGSKITKTSSCFWGDSLPHLLLLLWLTDLSYWSVTPYAVFTPLVLGKYMQEMCNAFVGFAVGCCIPNSAFLVDFGLQTSVLVKSTPGWSPLIFWIPCLYAWSQNTSGLGEILWWRNYLFFCLRAILVLCYNQL